MSKIGLFILVQLLQVIQPQSDVIGDKCGQVFHMDAIFSLHGLYRNTYYEYHLDNQNSLFFNICGYQHKQCTVNSELGSTYGMKVQYFQDDESKTDDGERQMEKCEKLTSNSMFNNYRIKLLDDYKQYLDENPEKGVSLTIKEGDIYNNQTQERYQMEFQIRCDTDDHIKQYRIEKVVQDGAKFTVIGDSPFGCPLFQFSQIWMFLENNKVLFSLILMLIGATECFYGLKILPATLFIIGYFTGFFILLSIMAEFVIKPETNVVVVWAMLIIAIILGLIVGYMTSGSRKFGFFCLGFWLGTIIAFLLNNALLYKLTSNNSQLYVAIILFGGGFGVLSFKHYKYIVMFGTSLIGSYMLIRPIGWLMGHFPNEFLVAYQIRHGYIDSIPGEFYIYFILIIAVGFVGMRWQLQNYYSEFENLTNDDIPQNIPYDENDPKSEFELKEKILNDQTDKDEEIDLYQDKK